VIILDVRMAPLDDIQVLAQLQTKSILAGRRKNNLVKFMKLCL